MRLWSHGGDGQKQKWRAVNEGNRDGVLEHAGVTHMQSGGITGWKVHAIFTPQSNTKKYLLLFDTFVKPFCRSY